MRYTSQLLYKHIGKKGQKKITNTSVAIIGVGALGSVCAELLARAGIGKIFLFDYQKIELKNLQRQFYFEEDIGKYKVFAMKKRIKKINSEVKAFSYNKRITKENLELMKKTSANIILCCTDDMATRFLLNEFCLKQGKTFITGMVAGSTGYLVKVINKKTPCFNCVFKKESCLNCRTEGILNSASSLIGSLIVNETIKTIVNKKDNSVFLYVDLWNNEFNNFKIRKRCELHK